jgi:hypothetical protein
MMKLTWKLWHKKKLLRLIQVMEENQMNNFTNSCFRKMRSSREGIPAKIELFDFSEWTNL